MPQVGLHSFKAGRLSRVEGTNRVKPDPRKGLIYLEEVDELLHFYWKDRSTGAVEDDLIIFPEEAEFVEVKESPKGRVFALKFTSSSQIMFYWMQEKESVDDEADVKRVNDLIADPKSPAPQSSESAGSSSRTEGLGGSVLGPAGASGLGNLDLSAAAQTMGMSQDQLMELLGSDRISSVINSGIPSNLFETGASGTDGAMQDVMDSQGSGAVAEQMPMDAIGTGDPSGEALPSAGQSSIPQINDDRPQTPTVSGDSHSLHSILSGIRIPGQQQQQRLDLEPLDLQDILTPEQIRPLLADPVVRQQLFPHLPSSLVSDPPTEAEVLEIMSSVQWKTALSGLSYALNHGGESAVRSLGLDASHLQGTSGVEAFIRAVADALQNERHDGDQMEE